MQQFTITPSRNRLGQYYADEDVDKGLEVAPSRGGRAARRRGDVRPEERRADRNRRSSRTRRISTRIGIRACSRRCIRSRSPGRLARPGPAIRPAAAASSSVTTRRTRARNGSSRRWRAAPIDGPVTDADLVKPICVLSGRASRRRFRGGHRDGGPRAAGESGVPVPRRARSGATRRFFGGRAAALEPGARQRPRSRRRACRSSSGAACRTTSCSTRPSRAN